MKTVEMPKMGDTMEEGKILSWYKHEGDSVKKGEMLAEVETDKVNIEIESFFTGVLRKILVKEGESAPIYGGIAYIGDANEPLPGGDTAPAAPPAAAKQAPAQPPITLGVDPVASFATSLNHAESVAQPAGRVFISPLARRLAEEYNLDYKTIRGTGPNGRIIKLDVESVIKQPAVAIAPVAPAPVVAAPVFTPTPLPAAVPSAADVEIPLTSMRRTIAKRLTQSMQNIPHFYVTSIIDTGKLGELRQQINGFAATTPNPVKVSFNDLIIKAVALALVNFPQVNVAFTEEKIIQKSQVHIGVAIALETGLIVPVLKNANQRGILDISREVKRLGEAARTSKLKPDDLTGGTFTISNLGMFGVDSFTAIINPPESAILAVGAITPTPAVVDGQVVVRDLMKVTLSSDHRALDGAVAARFLQELKRLLEEPFGLLL